MNPLYTDVECFDAEMNFVNEAETEATICTLRYELFVLCFEQDRDGEGQLIAGWAYLWPLFHVQQMSNMFPI